MSKELTKEERGIKEFEELKLKASKGDYESIIEILDLYMDSDLYESKICEYAKHFPIALKLTRDYLKDNDLKYAIVSTLAPFINTNNRVLKIKMDECIQTQNLEILGTLFCDLLKSNDECVRNYIFIASVLFANRGVQVFQKLLLDSVKSPDEKIKASACKVIVDYLKSGRGTFCAKHFFLKGGVVQITPFNHKPIKKAKQHTVSFMVKTQKYTASKTTDDLSLLMRTHDDLSQFAQTKKILPRIDLGVSILVPPEHKREVIAEILKQEDLSAYRPIPVKKRCRSSRTASKGVI